MAAVLTPKQLNDLDHLLSLLTYELNKLGAPRTMVARASEAQLAVEYARSHR